MKRRDFITVLGGAAFTGPFAASAQQTARMRRVSVLTGYAEGDPEAKALLAEFTQELSALGWIEGRNLRMDVRWAPGSTDLMHTFAKELVGLQPDVILAQSTPVTAALKHETQTIQIVFAAAADPVGSGFVASLTNPGGNSTVFGSVEASIASKWLDLLIEIAPDLKRATMIFNPDTAPHVKSYLLPFFEAAARSLKVALIAAPVHSDAEIETAITARGREPGGGPHRHAGQLCRNPSRAIHIAGGTQQCACNLPDTCYRQRRRLLSYGADFRDIFRACRVMFEDVGGQESQGSDRQPPRR